MLTKNRVHIDPCRNKKKYNGEEIADVVFALKRKTGRAIHSYKCKLCHYYHISTIPWGQYGKRER